MVMSLSRVNIKVVVIRSKKSIIQLKNIGSHKTVNTVHWQLGSVRLSWQLNFYFAEHGCPECPQPLAHAGWSDLAWGILVPGYLEALSWPCLFRNQIWTN